ncbi:ABC transporter substrate-binding protein [Planomicrobium sp. YIM 101495]|uniref:ABC transporter substrate-binding protein n=1 Tax=Planomicrobium sp. YIM 101495 TaxID=2665160 RepID=UPI0012B9A143|nr:ABC transporter substrate-binding protein [Planomicrobium sp. YIM 101495]MTD30736.1 peptide ABC transporter substrate-binding protein [Planomicrobium sp. YIM 101495]
MKNRKKALSVLLLAIVLILAACSDSAGDENSNQEKNEPVGDPQEGGTVTGALNTAPGGQFNPIFAVDLYEETILEFTHESLVKQNESLEFIPSLAKEWEMNEDQTQVTFHLEEGVTWHDGEEFTADDVVFTYQTMSDPDYISAGGFRTLYVEPLLGYEAYNSGETDEFQGVVADDEYTVTFHFAEPEITPLYMASYPIIPQHVFENIAVSDMPGSPESLEAGSIIGTGPFKFANISDREQYTLERHEAYWQGKPYLDQVVWRIVESSVMIGLLENGDIDFTARPNGIPPADFDTVSTYNHMELVEQTDFSYQVLGFKMNHRTADDVNDQVINPDNWIENEKLADQNIRQAIAYAINREGFVQGLLYGKGDVINSPIAQQHWASDESATADYSYDPGKAMEMLDEAGYVDQDGDGLRETPNGDEWVLNLKYPTGNQLRERSAPLIAQQLEEVGIGVDLKQPKEMTAFLNEMDQDNDDTDLYLIGWGLETADPDPTELWSIHSPWNYSRWNNEESEALITAARTAPDALDQAYRKEVYAEWQRVYSEDLPALLLYVEPALWTYNSRINGVEVLPHTLLDNSHLWWVNNAQ